MTLMSLMATLGMEVSGFKRGAQEAKTELTGLGQAAAGVGQSVNLSAQEIERVNSTLMSFAADVAAAGAALSVGFTAPLVGLATEAINLAGSFQQAEIGFSTMMHSAQNAGQFLNELKSFAASSPFEFPELLDASRRLMAMGFEASAVIPIMRTVGDAVAGLGGNAQTIDRITLALGQMQAKGRVSAQEMNQLAEAGIPAWQSLADAIGVSIPEAMRRAERGAITATQAIPAILQGMQEHFGGMMTAQMNTVAGQWSNFKDNLSFIVADIGRALLPFADMVLSVATPILSMLRDVAAGFAELPQPVQGVIVGLAALAAAVGPLALAFAGFTASVAAVGGALGTSGIAGILGALAPILGPLAIAITAAGAAWYAWDSIPAVRESVAGLWEALTGFWNETLRPFLETLAAGALAFESFAASVIGSGLEAAWEGLKAAGEALWTGIVALADALSPLWEAFGNVLDSLSPLLDPIRALATGLAEMATVLVAGGLNAAWEVFKGALSLVFDVVRGLGGFIVDVLLVGLRALTEVVRGASEVWTAVFKPAIEFVIEKLRDFMGVLASLPGVKQAIEAVGGSFDEMKAKVTGAVGEARAQITAWGNDTRTSVQIAKTALDEAQRSYDSIQSKFRSGKATTDELRTATERLAQAKSNFRSELERVKPRIDAVMQSVRDARLEYDRAETNLRNVQRAFNEGSASSDQLTAAQVRMKAAADGVKTANEALNRITQETGVSMTQYSGGIDAVKSSLEGKQTASRSAKEATDALKASVDTAKEAYRQTYEQFQNGLATEQQVIDKHTALQEAIDRLHPERVAERQAQGHQQMMDRYDQLLHWFETNIPKLEDLNNRLIISNAKLASEFEKEHQKIVDKAREQIVIDIKVTDRLPEEVNAAIRAQQQIQEAYRTLGVSSSQAAEEHARRAQAAYETIANSGKASAADVLRAEQAALKATADAYIAAGEEIPKSLRDRLSQIEKDLGDSQHRQKGLWETFTSDVIAIGQRLNHDFAAAVVDLFSGKGWDGFKDAGLNALKAIGDKIVEMGIDYVEGILSKHLKDIITDIIPDLTHAFTRLGSFLLDLFSSIGSTIVDGVKGAVGFIGGLFSGGGGEAVGGAVSAATGAASTATSAAGSAASVAGGVVSAGVTGLVGAVAGVASAVTGVVGIIQQMGQSKSLGQIEENTRFTQIALIGPNGVLHYLTEYAPKLEGFENFNYQVLAPGVADISNEVRDKGLGIWRAVDAAKDVIIQLKDSMHDLVLGLGDTNSFVGESNQWLQQVKLVLDDIRIAVSGTQVNTARFSTTGVEQAVSGLGFDLSNKLMTVAQSITGLAGSIGTSLSTAISPVTAGIVNLQNSIRDIDPDNALLTLQNSLQSTFSGLATMLNPNNALFTLNNTLAQQFAALSSSLITISNNSTRVQPPNQTIQNVYINGVQQASLAGALRSQGVLF